MFRITFAASSICEAWSCPVIDLKARLGLGLTEATPKHVIIVVNADEARTIGLLVRCGLGYSDRDVRGNPIRSRRSGESQNEYVEGISVLDGRMVTLLGMTKLTSSFAIDKALDLRS